MKKVTRSDAAIGFLATLVEPEFPVDRVELRRLDQLAVRDEHRMQRPLNRRSRQLALDGIEC